MQSRVKKIERVLLLVALVAIVVALVFSASSSEPIRGEDDSQGFRLGVDLTPGAAVASNDLLGLGGRLVFSTVDFEPRAAQEISLRNKTDDELRMTGARFGGASPEAFALANGQTTSVTIPPGSVRTVDVVYVPTTTGVQTADLAIEFSGRPALRLTMGGLNAVNFEGKFEPSLQQIFDAVGFAVNVDMPKTPPADINVPDYDRGNSISTLRSAVGDEVLAPYFRRADPAQPVRMIPIANYTSRSTKDLGPFGINARGSKTERQLVITYKGGSDDFGGQNQQLLPGVADGSFADLVEGSDVDLTPGFETFGIWDGTHDLYSDDSLNEPETPTSGPGLHAYRMYPAKDTNGRTIPNSYLVGVDSGGNDFKNYDYQDFVFLLRNVVPEGR